MFGTRNFGLKTLLLMMHVSYSIHQATHTSPQGLNSNHNQHTLAISQVLFCPECTNPLGSQGDTTEPLYREQLGSPIRQVRGQLSSHGSMAVGAFMPP